MIRTRHLLIAGAILFLVACLEPTKDWEDPNGEWTISGSPPGGDAELAVALATIREMSPETIPDAWWGGTIRFVDKIGDGQNAGVWWGANYRPGTSEYSIALVRPDGVRLTKIEQTALAHEVGHYLWTRLGRANANHPTEFTQWWLSVNTEIARRLFR